MNWIPVERGGVEPLGLYLVCGRQNVDGCPVIDVGWWDGEWNLTGGPGFTPQFYIVVEWPLELSVDDGAGL